ncbi:hypothetical protein AZ20_0417 [Bordetella bronchiseptica E014]|nr:hypothetical protein L507_0442 [Bordetella bronchiseptica CA90 BB02]KCV51990.1 hypothetical protein L492_0461 [Bordetella bronchiseptica 7E71]KDB76939.1 hypothetical protein L494_0443 [Bordetella bronchiseptica CA90 BB1334]KDC17632.1 hypothetical protein AZ20_0417 [Bordetella bronchiseptica E014]KDC22463.1 hypothetical protein L542_0449 [Bordetella bronchiseptica F-1]KDC29019.1 hypothetical protein L504_0468 [Bordetella bronchiseptica F2]KDC57215.1 hypothetical protein L510_0462 [Bordetell
MTVGPRRRAMKAQRQDQHGRRHAMAAHSWLTDIALERLVPPLHICTSRDRSPPLRVRNRVFTNYIWRRDGALYYTYFLQNAQHVSHGITSHDI